MIGGDACFYFDEGVDFGEKFARYGDGVMRILLFNAESGLYLGPEGEWVDLEEATVFGSSFSAVQAALELKGERLEVFFSFDNPAFNMSFPVRPAPGGGGRLGLGL